MWESVRRNSITPYAFEDELKWLRDHAAELPLDCNIAMIGAGPGVMAMAVLEGLRDCNSFIIIDIKTCEYAQAHIEAAKLSVSGLEYIVHNSATYKYPGEKLDLLIIDGDHSYQGVTRDIDNWYKHVKPCGKLFFHDVEDIENVGNNGVKEALFDKILRSRLDLTLLAFPGISRVYIKEWNLWKK